MSEDREAQFQQLVKDYPDSPMGHFSLGKLYLEAGKYPQAAQSLEEATRLDPQYAAAMVALGEAYAGAGQTQKARDVWEKAKSTALAQKHASLADEIDDKLAEL